MSIDRRREWVRRFHRQVGERRYCLQIPDRLISRSCGKIPAHSLIYPTTGRNAPNDFVPREVLPTVITSDQKNIDDWWSISAPAMRASIIPSAKNYMISSETDGFADRTGSQLREECIAGLRRLVGDGCKVDEQYARAAVLLMERPMVSLAGRARIAVRWREKIQRIDYTAQPIRIGVLHF